MLSQILQWDYRAFQQINQIWVGSWADLVFPFLREPLFWTPLYIFIFACVWVNSSSRRGALVWLFYWVLLIILCDGISSHIVKNLIFRPRPCVDLIWQGKVRLLVSYCSHRSSFTSSHAVNHFGMATFFAFTLRKFVSYKAYIYALFFLWAFAVAYAQVYVGLHYPLDITCGAMLGVIIGLGVTRAFNKAKVC